MTCFKGRMVAKTYSRLGLQYVSLADDEKGCCKLQKGGRMTFILLEATVKIKRERLKDEGLLHRMRTTAVYNNMFINHNKRPA
jgi:hypothetical protein